MGHPRGVVIFTSRWREGRREREEGREGEGEREREREREREKLEVRVVPSLPEQLLELHRGQGKDIYWRDSYISDSVPQRRSTRKWSDKVGS